MFREIGQVFLRLGIFGFGGPIATMAMMEEEAVRKRGWLTPREFTEIYAVCKLLPGPVATQMAIYLGQHRAGRKLGGLISGGLFILPSFLMVLGLSVLYAHTGIVSRAGPFLMGLQSAALSVILLSTWALGRPYRQDHRAWLIAALSSVVVFAKPGWEPWVILGAGLWGARQARQSELSVKSRAEGKASLHGLAVIPVAQAASTSAGGVFSILSAAPVDLQLFWTCFKAGAFVFGTGLAIVPVLEADAVAKYGWLTHSQFMDGLAIGQVTPGPVVITSTFMGYLANGLSGALAATVGMFLPAFFNVLFLVPRVWKRWSNTTAAAGFAGCAVPAVIGGILGTTLRLAETALASPIAIGVFVLSLVLAVWKKPPAWLLIPGAGLLSGLMHFALVH